MLKLRLIGTVDEITATIFKMKEFGEVLLISEAYPDKYNKNNVRIYIEYEVKNT